MDSNESLGSIEKETAFIDGVKKKATDNPLSQKLSGPLRLEISIIEKYPGDQPEEKNPRIIRKRATSNFGILVDRILDTLQETVIGESGEMCEIGPIGEYFGPVEGLSVKVEEIEKALSASDTRARMTVINGSRVEITDEDIQWAKNLARVYSKRYKVPSYRWDEMESRSLYYLWTSSLRFDPANEKKATLRTFVSHRIIGVFKDLKEEDLKESENLDDLARLGFTKEDRGLVKIPGDRLKNS